MFQIQNGNSDYLKWVGEIVPPLDQNAQEKENV